MDSKDYLFVFRFFIYLKLESQKESLFLASNFNRVCLSKTSSLKMYWCFNFAFQIRLN